jgi:hypothetical protein
MSPRPEVLIGLRTSDPVLSEFLERIEEVLRIDHFAELEIREYGTSGMALYIDKDQRLVSMFFYGTEDEEHRRYRGRSPQDLSFRDSPAAVAEKLGQPESSGERSADGTPWERFRCGDGYVHIEYFPDLRGIRMVTVMSSEMAEGSHP